MKFHQHFFLIRQYISLHSLQMHFVCFSSYFLTFDPTKFLHHTCIQTTIIGCWFLIWFATHIHHKMRLYWLDIVSIYFLKGLNTYNMHTSSVHYCSIIISLLPINNIIYRIFVTFFRELCFLSCFELNEMKGSFAYFIQ